MDIVGQFFGLYCACTLLELYFKVIRAKALAYSIGHAKVSLHLLNSLTAVIDFGFIIDSLSALSGAVICYAPIAITILQPNFYQLNPLLRPIPVLKERSFPCFCLRLLLFS
jgi:hypothetical protein